MLNIRMSRTPTRIHLGVLALASPHFNVVEIPLFLFKFLDSKIASLQYEDEKFSFVEHTMLNTGRCIHTCYIHPSHVTYIILCREEPASARARATSSLSCAGYVLAAFGLLFQAMTKRHDNTP